MFSNNFQLKVKLSLATGTWNVYDANKSCICISNSPWISIKMQSLKILAIFKFTWTRSILCIGVKWSSASACNPTWSSVERVLVSQMFFAGHHKAWSDQSFGFAGRKKKEIKTLIIWIFLHDDFLWPNFLCLFAIESENAKPLNNNKSLFSGIFHVKMPQAIFTLPFPNSYKEKHLGIFEISDCSGLEICLFDILPMNVRKKRP